MEEPEEAISSTSVIGFHRPTHKICIIPQRYIVALMMCLGIAFNILTRVPHGIVTRHIMDRGNVTHQESDTSVCNRTFNSSFVRIPGVKYKWDPKLVRITDDIFWAGYILMQLPGGYLADMYGGKHVLNLSCFISFLVTIVTPAAILNSDGNQILILFLHILLGLASGPVFPSVNSIVGHWVPERDRGKLSAIVFLASQVAMLLNNGGTNDLIVLSNSWSSVFYLYGALGVVWCFTWHLFCYSFPSHDPYLDQREWNYLATHLGGHVTTNKKKVPWLAMLTCIPLWALALTHLSHIWIWYLTVHDLPIYLKEVVKYDIHASHFLKTVPYFIMGTLNIAWGYLTDYLVNNGSIRLISIRKIFATFGTMGPGIFTIGSAYSGCKELTVKVTFTSSLSAMSCYYPGTRANSLDLAPNFSGTIMGFINTLASFTWIVVPRLLETVLLKNTMSAADWTYFFWIHLLVQAITNIVFVLFASTDEQPWNSNVKEEETQISTASVDESSSVGSEAV